MEKTNFSIVANNHGLMKTQVRHFETSQERNRSLVELVETAKMKGYNVSAPSFQKNGHLVTINIYDTVKGMV